MSSTSSENDAEKLLREKYVEIAKLAGGLAHEIRNPLSTISLNVGVLKEELDEANDPREARMLKRIVAIQDECHRLTDFLDDFLQYTRVIQPQLTHIDLSEFVWELIEFIQPDMKASGVEISPHLDADLPAVSLDPAQFKQALLNLTRNAQQAMPDGGTIEFQTYRTEEDVVLEIIDTGKGIQPENCETIFETFYSTKPGGSGLGLPTVKKIIEAHQGTIHCASEIGKGTRFRITLPAAEKELT